MSDATVDALDPARIAAMLAALPANRHKDPSTVRGLVYFIEAVGSERIKIGWTGSRTPARRLEDLRTSSPFPLLLLGFVSGTLWHERRLHAQFASEREHGEWFRASARLRAYIARVP